MTTSTSTSTSTSTDRTLAITGATGALGRLVVQALLDRGVPAGQIVAAGRNTAALDTFAAQGVQVRRADYDDQATLDAAVKGADRVLIVSGTDFGRRVAQHTAVAQAARAAGAGLVAYTSAPYADRTKLALAAEHRGTEEAIRALGVPFAFLRNSWYHENYTAQIPVYLQHGAVFGSAGEGRVSGAARADYAEAAAAVLLGEGHENTALELGGDTSFTLAELAATVAAQSGREVAYRELPLPELTDLLVGAGFPRPVAEVFADTDRGIREGELLVESGTLSTLIGRPTTPLADAVAAALV